MRFVKRLKIVRWDVEEHTGGEDGIGKGSRTGTYNSETDAILAMASAKASGNGVTCIVRNIRGEGKLAMLGIVK